MPTKELSEYVRDMDYYRAHWGVSRKAGSVFLAIPFVLVALIIAFFGIVGS